MTNQAVKTLAENEHWKEIIKDIEYSLGRNYKHYEDDAQTNASFSAMCAEVDSNQAIIEFCIQQLQARKDYDQVWNRFKAAALLLNYVGYDNDQEVNNALWKAAERSGVESWKTLGGEHDDSWTNWQKYKYTLDSILWTLAQNEEYGTRMERFFNSRLTEYWKSFYIDWDGFCGRPDELQTYLSKGGFHYNHKIIYYELLAYRLENHDTQFERHSDKVKNGFKWLTKNPDDIPEDLTLRKRIYKAMSFYLEGKQYENTQIFNEIFKILKHDTIGFILSDSHFQQQKQEAGKMLLSANKILEKTWDTNHRLHGDILPAILAAMDHRESQVQRKAKEFLKKRAPDEIQQKIESLIDDLDSAANPDAGSNLISNLIEFGSQVAIKAVLRKCVIWIANDENWMLIDRAAQKLRMTPAAVQPLVYQLNIAQEDKQIRDLLRTKVLVEQDNFVLTSLYFQNDKLSDESVKTPEETVDVAAPQNLKEPDKVSDKTVETPFDRFLKLDSSNQQRYLEHLEKWSKSFESRSKSFADQIAIWQENIAQGEKAIRARETIDLAKELLDLLTWEKIEEHNLKVQRWITDLLSHMSDPRYFENKTELAKEMTGNLEKFAVEPLSKRLPTEDDLDIRENIVRVLGNVGGPSAVDTLVRTVSGKERERKARQALLADYYLKPSKERSEEAAALLNDAVDNAKKTMRLLQILNAATFVLGALLLIGGVIVAVISDELATRFVGFFSGLGGIGAIVTIFLKDPLKRIQNAMGDLVQIQTAFTGFVWDLNLNGTYIQSQYVAEGILTDYDIRQTTRRMAESIDKTMSLIQVYTEGDYEAGPPHLSYMLPPSGSDGSTVAIFGENLRGKAINDRKAKCQIAINHKPIDPIIETWTDHFVIFQLAPQMIETLKTEQSGESSRLWISFMIDEIETNALPFSLAG